MPEEQVIDQSQSQEPPKGSAALGAATVMGDMESIVTPPKPVEDTPKEQPKVDKPSTKETPKEVPKQQQKQADKPKEQPKADDQIKDPVQLRQNLKKVKEEYESYKTTTQQKLEATERQMSELQKKRYWTSEDEDKFKKLETKSAQLEQTLYARDYRESPEFKEKFETRAAEQYKQAVAAVRNITLEFKQGDEVKTRPATVADFESVRNAPREQQYMVAFKIFGQHSGYVLNEVNRLNQIQDDAEREVSTRRSEWEKQQQEQAGKFNESKQTYDSTKNQFTAQLAEKYPQFFAEPKYAQEREAFDKGRKIVDAVVNGIDKMPVAERAERVALVQSWAASWPRMNYIISQRDATIASLEEELKSFRDSDPGKDPKTSSGGGKPSDEVKGTANLVSEMFK